MDRGICDRWQNNIRRAVEMIEIDLNEQFIIYAIYKGCGKWYISDKELWYLDYQKRIEAYRKVGYEKIYYVLRKKMLHFF